MRFPTGGFPEGGSLEFARGIEKRFLDLGGKIFYGKKVDKILVKDGIASGVKLSKGEEILCDYVISCADLHTTVYQMLDGILNLNTKICSVIRRFSHHQYRYLLE